VKRRRVPTLPVVLVAAEQLAVIDARRELDDFAAIAARMYGIDRLDPAPPACDPWDEGPTCRDCLDCGIGEDCYCATPRRS
jgi:hypothetical protein